MKQVCIDYVYCTLQYRITQLPNIYNLYGKLYGKKERTRWFVLNQLANSFGSTSHLSLINYIKTVSLRSELFKM